MTTVHVFDPAMCCSTGICGPSVDRALVRFASDLAWLQRQGVTVERFNLSQQPAAFAADAEVKAALTEHGEACLPLVKIGGTVVSQGRYPSRADLATLAGLTAPTAAEATPAPTPTAAAAEAPCCGPSKPGARTGCC
ncbi:MAG: arsenite efflux transporter metallochaperone ArsD [Kofleriaceae bacterium]|nr:arsenite efflux transporter metallochaperone ArsD [Kofleriaceae bacterium]